MEAWCSNRWTTRTSPHCFKGLWEQIFSVFFILLKEFFLTGFNWIFYYNTIALRFIYLLAYLYAGVILKFINVYSIGILCFMLYITQFPNPIYWIILLLFTALEFYFTIHLIHITSILIIVVKLANKKHREDKNYHRTLNYCVIFWWFLPNLVITLYSWLLPCHIVNVFIYH